MTRWIYGDNEVLTLHKVQLKPKHRWKIIVKSTVVAAAVIEKGLSREALNNEIRDLVKNRGHFIIDYCGHDWKFISPYLPEIKVIKSTQPLSSIRKIVRICANTKIHEYKSQGIGDIAFVALYLNALKVDLAGEIIFLVFRI